MTHWKRDADALGIDIEKIGGDPVKGTASSAARGSDTPTGIAPDTPSAASNEEYTRRVFESHVTASAGSSGRELPHPVPSGDGHSGTQPATPFDPGSFDSAVLGVGREQHGQ